MFDSTEVKRLARLARIAVDDPTAAGLGADLERIMALVDQLKVAKVEGIAPMAHPLARAQRLRADAVTESPERDLYQRNAPDTIEGVYRVPQVINRS